MRNHVRLGLVLLLAAFATLARADDEPKPLAKGDDAPAFTAKDQDGKEVKLADLKGKRVLLWFYPKADTGGWTLEGCGFRDLSAEFEKKNVVILGISYDSPEANKAFAKKNDFPYRLLTDADKDIAKKYGAFMAKKPYPARRSFLISADGKIEQAWAEVDPRKHAKEVLDSLN
jgi:peroxiredoxin Q/BCP